MSRPAPRNSVQLGCKLGRKSRRRTRLTAKCGYGAAETEHCIARSAGAYALFCGSRTDWQRADVTGETITALMVRGLILRDGRGAPRAHG
jgi:hypothetical protein